MFATPFEKAACFTKGNEVNMETGALATFSRWENFYVILGSAAAGLTGLQFVVIALVADRRAAGSLHTIDTFATPTIIHFCAALMVSAILTSPWPSLASAGLAVAITGLAGIVYSVVILRRVRGEVDYKPVLEDWIWHTVLPMAAYVVLFLAGAFLTHHPENAPFVVGGTVLLLLFIGIHNAWDSVTWIAVEVPAENAPKEK
jgi:hypothetical protein